MSRSMEPIAERARCSATASPAHNGAARGPRGAVLELQRTAGNRAVGALFRGPMLQRDEPKRRGKVAEPEYEAQLSIERLDRRRFKVRYGKDVLGTVEVEDPTGEIPGRLDTWLRRRMQFLDKTEGSLQTQQTIDFEVRHDPNLRLRWRPSKDLDRTLRRHGMMFKPPAWTPMTPPIRPDDRDVWPAPGHRPRLKLPPLEPWDHPRRRDAPSDEPEPVRPKRRDADSDEVEEVVTTIVDLTTDFVPGVSNVKDLTTALTGVNPVTGEKVGIFGRILAFLFSIPGVGNVLKYIGKGFKLLGRGLVRLGRLLGRPLRALGRWGARQAARVWGWLGKGLARLRRRRAAKAAREAVEQQADEAIEAARSGRKPAAKAAWRAVDAVLAAVLEHLRKWAAGVFRQGEFPRTWVEFEGTDVVIYGQGSKIRIVRIRISAIKDYTVEKTEKLLALLKKRKVHLDAARKATSDAAWAMMRKRAIDVTEEIGEHVGNILVKRHFPGAKLVYRGSGANVLDLVYEWKGRWIVCEAKGHFSRLGYRATTPSVLAQQGTLTYLDATIKVMAASRDAVVRAKAAALEAARKAGKVTYVVTKTGSLNAAGESLAAKLVTIVQ